MHVAYMRAGGGGSVEATVAPVRAQEEPRPGRLSLTSHLKQKGRLLSEATMVYGP